MSADSMPDRLLSPEEVAVFCGVGRKTIYVWIQQKRFPIVRLRHLVRIRMSDLEHYLQQNTEKAIGF